jgi:hypothetical protein
MRRRGSCRIVFVFVGISFSQGKKGIERGEGESPTDMGGCSTGRERMGPAQLAGERGRRAKQGEATRSAMFGVPGSVVDLASS